MAKRADSTIGPYRPLLDTGLVLAAMAQPAQQASADVQRTKKVIDLPRTEQAHQVAQSPHDGPDNTRDPFALIVEKFDQEKRVLFTRSESQSINRLVASLATRLGTQVKTSHVMRALVALLLHAEDELDKRAGDLGLLTRPANGDAHALQKFEKEIGKIIATALRDAGPLK
jgi:hypothetical protein